MHQISDYQLAKIKESAMDNLALLRQLKQHAHKVEIEIRDTEEVLEICEAIRKGN